MTIPNQLFIDTWGWLTLFDKREAKHEWASTFYRRLRSHGSEVYTTDYVLDETCTLLFKRLPVENAMRGYDSIAEAAETGFLTIEWITPERFERAMDLRRRYDDKPGISFTDLTSMAVMQETEVRDVLTADAHFEHVGLAFQCRP